MKYGAVALIDALGFKSIHERMNPDQLLERMEDVFFEVKKIVGGTADVRPQIIHNDIMMVSDSVFLSSWYENKPVNQDHCLVLVDSVALMACTFYAHSLTKEIPLAYRGCICVGEFTKSDKYPIFAGPAVSSTAILERAAEGPFIWFGESVLEEMREAEEPGEFTRHSLVEYAVPLKAGGEIETWVVDPIYFMERNGISDEICERCLETLMQSVEGEERKHRTALKFHWERYLDQIRSDLEDRD